MNLKFFGEWLYKKKPININDDFCYKKLCDDCKTILTEEITKNRVTGMSIVFWAVLILPSIYIIQIVLG